MSTMRRRLQVPGFPAIQSAAAKLALALVIGSVVFALSARSIGPLLLLVPELFLTKLALWQPFTYVFIETSAMGVIFGALIVWSIGTALEATWGGRRMVWFAVGTTVAAGFLT